MSRGGQGSDEGVSSGWQPSEETLKKWMSGANQTEPSNRENILMSGEMVLFALKVLLAIRELEHSGELDSFPEFDVDKLTDVLQNMEFDPARMGTRYFGEIGSVLQARIPLIEKDATFRDRPLVDVKRKGLLTLLPMT